MLSHNQPSLIPLNAIGLSTTVHSPAGFKKFLVFMAV